MTSDEYLKEKLQRVTDAVATVADLADIIREAIPKDVLHDILPSSGDNIETVEAFDMIEALTKSAADLLSALTYGILSDVRGISALDQADIAEAHIINELDDSESAYPFDPDKYLKEESAE